MFNSKIDKLSSYDNEISKLKTQKTEYLMLIQGLDEKISNKLDEKRDYGINYYMDKGKRETLLETAEKYGYSPRKIQELRRYVDEWNQDNVTNDVLDSFRTLEEFIKNNQESYKENIMYKISKLFDGERGNSNEN